MTVDFAKVVMKDIEGNGVIADVRKQLGNQLYMQGRNIEECELGKKIYFSDGALKISDGDAQVIRQFVAGWSYVARQGIEDMLNNSLED